MEGLDPGKEVRTAAFPTRLETEATSDRIHFEKVRDFLRADSTILEYRRNILSWMTDCRKR